jgi:signal peptidase I
MVTEPALLAPAPSVAPSSALPVRDSFRETIESIAVAFILAFVFRTFVAEPFVIPTGSMAPTLMGRHKDVICPKCQFAYTANAAQEVHRDSGERIPYADVLACTCPVCRYTVSLAREPAEVSHAASYNGDRILASKFPGQSLDPSRWEVMVFHYPENARDNYIKRLVGLPGELVRIHAGDIWTRPLAEPQSSFTIARKPPEKIRAMMQIVHNGDHPAPELTEAGWPARWQAGADTAAQWEAVDPLGRSFQLGASDETAWLRYRHLIPSYDAWQKLSAGQKPSPPHPQLVTDFYAYNTCQDQHESGSPTSDMLGLHWVGDLILDADVTIQSASGPSSELILELVEAGRQFRCTIDLADGSAQLSISDQPKYAPRAETPLRAGGTFHLSFANVDNQLLLWVDDELMSFDGPTEFEVPAAQRPQAADLSPIGIAARNAAIRVDHLQIHRDLYYIAVQNSARMADYRLPNTGFPAGIGPQQLANLMSDPKQWDAFTTTQPRDYPLEQDQFLFLGDNSPQSSDSRLWPRAHYVRRELLIGQAVYVYWPHAWELPWSVPVAAGELRFPFYPNVDRMRWIR